MSEKKEAVFEEWRRLIAECENRPKGVKFSDWCKSVGVSKTNYYYWKKRLGELESDTPQIVKMEADTLVSEEEFNTLLKLHIYKSHAFAWLKFYKIFGRRCVLLHLF